ncbi:hypothetical protein [Xinfangfangia pollutisoli]|uniref:hypothetical protein n=1 Tax=Xinfangfangia pollutisoli TaxID=2865960 RepID=UPI001CD608D4|nr:hypothetical protein [Xinfangfangia pollutisoli]
MDIQFKEKTYEKYFGHELARLTNVTFSPDQVDEASLGFDEAFLLPFEWFHKFGPYFRRSRRERLTGAEISEFNKAGAIAASYMPKFKFNLFVQFKRPEFINSHRAKEWSHWGQSYYRYATTPHQQEALENIEAHSAGRAATIYASPAFWQVADLWLHVEKMAVVGRSNMASVAKLTGHGRYTYIANGFVGKGHSDVVGIEGEPIEKIILRGMEANDELSLDDHLKATAATILESTGRSDLAAPVFQRVQSAKGAERLEPNSLYDAIEIIRLFAEAFDVRCYAFG